MKSWKFLLGVGGACAVCCAFPVAGWFAALAALAAGGWAWSVDTMFVAGASAAVLAFTVAGLVWRRRRAAQPAACTLGAPGACGCRPEEGCR